MNPEAEAVRQEYDRLAVSYDRRWRTYVQATLRAVVESLDLKGQEHILDIACGTGELEKRLLARWPALKIVGTDISPGMLAAAADKEGNERATWVRAEADRLPFPDGTFDFVVCANSFHYFRSPLSALREASRLLRPHGRLILVDWCDDYWSCKLCGLWLRWTDPVFCRTYTLRDAAALLKQAGFEALQTDDFRVQWIWGMMRFVCRKAEAGAMNNQAP